MTVVWRKVGKTMRKVRILGSGKWQFMKGKARSHRSPSSRKARHKSNTKGVRKSMPRRRRYFARRTRRSGGMTIPIAPIAGLVGTIVSPPGGGFDTSPLNMAQSGRYDEAVRYFIRNISGFDTRGLVGWEWPNGLTGMVAGLLIHKFVGGRPLNLNATLGRAKVPIIRL